jgi:hypothetical protein
MRPRVLTTAKKVAKVSVIGDTAGEKKSLEADPQVLTTPPATWVAGTPALSHVDTAACRRS